MRVLLKLILLWCLKLAMAAPAIDPGSRWGRQWVIYEQPPVIYQDLIPEVFPYGPLEMTLQVSGMSHPITIYSPSLDYVPQIQYEGSAYLKEPQANQQGDLKSTTNTQSFNHSKLNLGKNVFKIFGLEHEHKTKPLPQATTTSIDFNTVSVLPRNLDKFLSKLKEESTKRNDGSDSVPVYQSTRHQGSIRDAIEKKISINKFIVNSDTDLLPSAREDRNVGHSVEADSGKEEKIINELSNEQLHELIDFFDTIKKIYNQAGYDSLTGTIDIVIKSDKRERGLKHSLKTTATKGNEKDESSKQIDDDQVNNITKPVITETKSEVFDGQHKESSTPMDDTLDTIHRGVYALPALIGNSVTNEVATEIIPDIPDMYIKDTQTSNSHTFSNEAEIPYIKAAEEIAPIEETTSSSNSGQSDVMKTERLQTKLAKSPVITRYYEPGFGTSTAESIAAKDIKSNHVEIVQTEPAGQRSQNNPGDIIGDETEYSHSTTADEIVKLSVLETSLKGQFWKI